MQQDIPVGDIEVVDSMRSLLLDGETVDRAEHSGVHNTHGGRTIPAGYLRHHRLLQHPQTARRLVGSLRSATTQRNQGGYEKNSGQ